MFPLRGDICLDKFMLKYGNKKRKNMQFENKSYKN
jgi:hypothetical protein